MTIEVNHSLTDQEAYDRTERLLSDLERTHAGRISNVEKWWGASGPIKVFTFSFDLGVKLFFITKYIHVDGKVFLYPSKVQLTGGLPLAARMFESQIKETIREQMVKTYKK